MFKTFRVPKVVGSESWSMKKEFQQILYHWIIEINTYNDFATEALKLVVAAKKGGGFLNMSKPISKSAWIIDFVATNHIKFDSSQVLTLKPSLQKFVSIESGTSTWIIGEKSLPHINV